VKTAWPQRS